MKISESCAKCLYDRQRARMPDEDYLKEVRSLLEERGENDSSPLLVYRFNQAYARRFGSADSYAGVKRSYNDLVLSMADHLRAQIEASDDPLAAALAYARVGNYIDFGAMDTVDEATFLGLFKEAVLQKKKKSVYESFLLAEAQTFYRNNVLTYSPVGGEDASLHRVSVNDYRACAARSFRAAVLDGVQLKIVPEVSQQRFLFFGSSFYSVYRKCIRNGSHLLCRISQRSSRRWNLL